jgi:hypothetical protein
MSLAEKDATMALASSEGDCVRLAQSILEAALETQTHVRRHPELAELYASAAPTDVYARNQLRSTLAAMPQLSALVVSRIHREVLNARVVEANATACPGCGAGLSRAEIDLGECPYCRTSLYTPALGPR